MRPPLFVLLLAAFATAPATPEPPDQGAKPAARANKAMVSSSHPVVTETMIDVLRSGGNAIDAVVTATILQHVIEPQMSTLAGGMSLLFYEARTGRLYYLDAELDHSTEGAPIHHTMGGDPRVPETSGRRIGVPGTVAGLYAAAERFGTREWTEYFGPAVELASDGFPMYSFLYAEMVDAAMGRVSKFPSGRETYLQDGFVPPVGTTIKRPRLAATLRRLGAEGPDFFYSGDWARHFVEAAQRTGGRLSLADLASYEVRWEEPVRTTFHGDELVSSPPPATAGTLIAMILNILEHSDLNSMPHFSESARTLALVRQAFGLAETNSETYVRDPRAADVPLDTSFRRSTQPCCSS